MTINALYILSKRMCCERMCVLFVLIRRKSVRIFPNSSECLYIARPVQAYSPCELLAAVLVCNIKNDSSSVLVTIYPLAKIKIFNVTKSISFSAKQCEQKISVQGVCT